MGEKPLCYTIADGTLVFASELRALLAHLAVSARLDPEGLARYLAFDYIPDPHSILRGVHKLPPGHRLTGCDSRLAVGCYWDIPFRPEPHVQEREWLEEIVRRVDRAVELRRSRWNHRKTLWSLLAFELWRTEYLGDGAVAW
jgi:asparagine synthase (glutamine-hydrolysing)